MSLSRMMKLASVDGDFGTGIFTIKNRVAYFHGHRLVFLTVPIATTLPRCGFSFAVSGMMIPDAVFSSAAAASTSTRSPRGFRVSLLMSVLI